MAQARPQVVNIATAFRGLEDRPSLESPETARIAINCEFSDGSIRPRPGFEEVKEWNILDTGPNQGKMIKFTDRFDQTWFMVVGPESSGEDVLAITCHPSGDQFASVVLPGEPYDADFNCSLMECFIDGDKTILISTKTQVYFFKVNGRTIRVPDLTVDAVKYDVVNAPYWNSHPKGYATYHNNRVFYSGFSINQEIILDGTVPEDQTWVPETWLFGGRSKMTIQPAVFAFGDSVDPVGLHVANVVMVEPHERAMGTASIAEKLIMFTDRGIYQLTGDPGLMAHGFNVTGITKLVNGYGCVDPHSIQVTPAGIFYLSYDGLRLFTGESTRIPAFDHLWKGSASTRVPDVMEGVMETLGYPWRVIRAAPVVSLHRDMQSEVWFQVQVNGGYVVLVYNYELETASVYCRYDMGRMFGGYMQHEGREYVTQGGKLLEIRRDAVDDTSAGPPGIIPQLYVSSRFMRGNEERYDYRYLRLHLEARGRGSSSTRKAKWFMEGSDASFDEMLGGASNAAVQATSGDLDTHPHTDNSYFLDSFVLGTEGNISGITAANPAVVTLDAGHGLETGATVTITGTNSTPAIDGTHTITKVAADEFSVPVTTTGTGNVGNVDWTADPDQSTLTSRDIFVSKVYPEPVCDKWLVWGFYDVPTDAHRPPWVRCYGATVEVHPSGGTR